MIPRCSKATLRTSSLLLGKALSAIVQMKMEISTFSHLVELKERCKETGSCVDFKGSIGRSTFFSL